MFIYFGAVALLDQLFLFLQEFILVQQSKFLISFVSNNILLFSWIKKKNNKIKKFLISMQF